MTLQDTIDEFVSLGKINGAIADKMLNEFDKATSNALASRVRTRLSIKCNRLRTYRFCDNVWTLLLKEAEFREGQELIRVDWVKIVACDGKQVAIGQESFRT